MTDAIVGGGAGAEAFVGGRVLALIAATFALLDRCTVTSDAPVDEELVHDVRVSMRRLRSVLRTLRGLYGGRVVARADEALIALLDLTSDLRDEEVLRETLAKLAVDPATRAELTTWSVGRKRREDGARARGFKAICGADPAALHALARRIDKRRDTTIDAATFSRDAIDQAIARLEERSTEALASSDPVEMHRARIAAKKLRYIAALLGGRPTRTTLTSTQTPAPTSLNRSLEQIEQRAAKIQKRLGDLHDLDEASVRMGRAWGLSARSRGAILKALEARRTEVAARATAELRDDVARLRTLFESVGSWEPSVALEERRDALPNPDAQAGDAAPSLEVAHRVEQRDGDASA